MKTVVVMPAYNAAETLEKTVRDIPPGSADEVLLVDDGSSDATVAVAHKLGLIVVRHRQNRGYGGNQKTCYDLALDRGAEIIIMVHPDYQYDSRLVPYLRGFIEANVCDIVLGNRIRTRREARRSGMPLYKYLSNRALSLFENVMLGQNLGEWHTGYRAYHRRVLETIPYHRNSEDFVFDSQLLVQAVHFGFRLGDVPVPVRYMPEASSINFPRSVRYGIGTVLTVFQLYAHRAGLKRSPLFTPARLAPDLRPRPRPAESPSENPAP